MGLTCGHVYKNALARPHVGHLKQHHVGGQVVDGNSGAFLEAHLLGHGEGAVSGHDNHLLKHAEAAHRDHTISHLREEREGEGVGQVTEGAINSSKTKKSLSRSLQKHNTQNFSSEIWCNVLV